MPSYVNTPNDMRFLVQWVVSVQDHVHKALGATVVAATEIAYADAVERAKTQFNNTPGYVRTGGLMNAIYRGFDSKTGKGFLGVANKYGALLEFGGTVRAQNARHLWVKNWLNVPNSLRRMTPREWMAARAATPAQFRFGKGVALYQPPGGGRASVMFWLRDEVTIDPRPYIRPAIAQAYAQMPALLQSRLARSGGTP